MIRPRLSSTVLEGNYSPETTQARFWGGPAGIS
jgi:hypothetical protein